jgi:hypothetical protein
MYYPKSQIVSNLYTNGEEFVYTDNKEPYSGYYYKTSDGKYYTGKTPQDLPNEELSLLQIFQDPLISTPNVLPNYTTTTNIYEQSNEEYLNIKSLSPTTTLLPYYNPQQPTQQDYQNTEFRRYFCKKTNEILYIEINKDQYDKLIAKDPQILWQLYLPFNITWQLTGDEQQVARVNKNMVELAMKNLKLPKFNLYIKEDYTKYYQ